jgi:hypothetical protein
LIAETDALRFRQAVLCDGARELHFFVQVVKAGGLGSRQFRDHCDHIIPVTGIDGGFINL